MLQFYKQRLSTYKKGLKDCLRTFKHNPGTPIDIPGKLSEIFLACDEANDLSYDAIVLLTNQIRVSSEVEKFLLAIGDVGDRLWHAICLMGRLKQAHSTFLEAAKAFPSFSNVTILAVSPPSPLQIPENMMTLSETLSLQGKVLSQSVLQQYLHPRLAVNDAQRRYSRLQEQEPHVHAEVQLLLHLLRQGTATSEIYSYLGCSKRCCFLCSKFLLCYGNFNSRGCHGRLYSRWALPSLAGYSVEGRKLVFNSFKKLQTILNEILISPLYHGGYAAESSLGMGTPKSTENDRPQVIPVIQLWDNQGSLIR